MRAKKKSVKKEGSMGIGFNPHDNSFITSMAFETEGSGMGGEEAESRDDLRPGFVILLVCVTT